MKRISYFLFALAVLIFVISLFVNIYANKTLEEFVLPATVNVTDSAAFDVSGDKLSFGKILPRGSATRTVLFDNNYDFPVIVKISSRGEISSLLLYQDAVSVEKGERKNIGISVFAGDFPQGYYTGEVRFIVKPA